MRAGLPRAFVEPWDLWLQAVLPATRIALGDLWQQAWQVAPVWRFGLAAHICGPDAVGGVLMPSTDRTGRDFPLTIARTGGDPPGCDWYDLAGAAGREALEHDLAPDALIAGLDIFRAAASRVGPAEACQLASRGSEWWTDGSPFVPATRFTIPGLPDSGTFASMLAAREGTR